jgi:hypothetical protein
MQRVAAVHGMPAALLALNSGYPDDGGATLRIAAWVRTPDASLAGGDLHEHAKAALKQAGCPVAA